jgi:hypothetical protein
MDLKWRRKLAVGNAAAQDMTSAAVRPAKTWMRFITTRRQQC